MAQLTKSAGSSAKFTLIPPALTLAIWRFRDSWRSLALTGLGALTAVIIICAMPLFAQVTVSSGFRNALTQTPQSSIFTVNVNSYALTETQLQNVYQNISPLIQSNFGSYLTGAPIASAQSYQLIVSGVSPASKTVSSANNVLMQFAGYSMSQAASHVRLIAGALPNANSSALPIALTQDSMNALGISVGAKITLIGGPNGNSTTPTEYHAVVVGEFAPISPEETFWGDLSFTPVINSSSGNSSSITIMALTDTAPLLHTFRLSNSTSLNLLNNQGFVFNWQYQLDPSKISVNNVNQLYTNAQAIVSQLPNALSGIPQIMNSDILGDSFSILASYSQLYDILQIPATVLILQILGLILLFVSVSSELFIEQQAPAIAILHSRGASRRQIFMAMSLQTILISLIALLIGPIIALEIIRFAATHFLPIADQSANNILNNPVQVIWSVRWYALVAIAGSIIGALVSIGRASGMDALSLRRETSRSARKPFWQRFNIDIILAALGAAIYGMYILAVQNIGPFFMRAFSIFSLLAPVLLLASGAAIFTRLFPLLAKLITWLATKSKGAAAMVAYARISRQPRQTMRTTLLLSLSLGFMLFMVIFNTTQQQRVSAITDFNTGADFSGLLPQLPASLQTSATTIESQYTAVQGVQAASAGAVINSPPSGNPSNTAIDIAAVNSNTFGAAAIWTNQDSSQPLSALLQQLALQRQTAESSGYIPAYVDSAAAAALHLATGNTFSLQIPGATSGALRFIVTGKIALIPTIYDTTAANYNMPQDVGGAILVDYATLASVFQSQNPSASFQPNYIWLKTTGNTAELSAIRQTLQTGALALNQLRDRRAAVNTLQNDPLQITILGILNIGALAVLLLAFIGAISAAAQSAREMRLNFTILKALGADRSQILSIITNNQLFIFGLSGILGTGLGFLLALVVAPTLVFTNIDTTSTQSQISTFVPPIQIVYPWAYIGAILAIVVFMFIFTTLLVQRSAAKENFSQTLRLNED